MIGTQAVAKGTAVLSLGLASGPYALSASYSGDADYLSSQSAGALDVAIATPDFSVALVGLSEQTIH